MSMFRWRDVGIYELMKRPKGVAASPPTERQKKLRGPMTFDILDELERNNKERARRMIREMGEKWICHPSNGVKRREKPYGF